MNGKEHEWPLIVGIPDVAPSIVADILKEGGVEFALELRREGRAEILLRVYGGDVERAVAILQAAFEGSEIKVVMRPIDE
ncbi:hypothetical protein ABZY81_17005 [Streptomyces sp. NPDC006514]|uniref:hypothetical protein n=1 Tax=Streptomyces sp. NPDC006514 TaxID=3154308 RepID=UPI0033B485B0